MTQPRLIDVPVDPATLTDRQRAALEIVRAWSVPIRPMEVGANLHGHGENYPWSVCTNCFRDGLSVLRELHRKGLVKRVGRGGGRWALSEGGNRTGFQPPTEPVHGVAAPPSSPSACGLCGKDPAAGFATINDQRYCHEGADPTCYMQASWDQARRYDPETADIPF